MKAGGGDVGFVSVGVVSELELSKTALLGRLSVTKGEQPVGQR